MAISDEEILYSTGCALTIFHLFSKLPNSIRVSILLYAAPAPRTRFLEVYGFSSPIFKLKIRYIPRLPALFTVSRETRDFSIAYEGGSLSQLFAELKPENTFYVNFKRDIIFLSSRFVSSATSKETCRQRKLSSLLKPAFLSQVRKVVVTYSGVDDFAEASIAGVLLDSRRYTLQCMIGGATKA